MRRIIHTFILAFQFIILPAVFTACKDDGGNISPLQEVTPAFSWEENSFLLETDNGWGITRFSNRIALSNFSQKRQYHLSWNDTCQLVGKFLVLICRAYNRAYHGKVA